MNDKNSQIAARHLDPDKEFIVKKTNGPHSGLEITHCFDPTSGQERYFVEYKDRENNTRRKSGKVILTEHFDNDGNPYGVGDKTIILEDCPGKNSVNSVTITGAQ